MKIQQLTPLTAAALTAALLCSCSGEKKTVTDFATSFAGWVADAKADSILAVYPDSKYAEKLAIDFVADSLTVDKSDTAGVYKVSYRNGVSALVKIDPNGNCSITETRGVFSYPKEKLEFARKTGALKDDETDVELATTMATVDALAGSLYEKYSQERKKAIVVSEPVITRDVMFMLDEGAGYYTLTNTTSQPVKGSEYTITWQGDYLGPMGDSTNHSVENGKDIPANGSVNIPFEFTGRYFPTLKKVTMKEMSVDEFFAAYEPQGREFATYVKDHGHVAPVVAGEGLGDGPFELNGKIGGKHAVRMTLDKGMKTGSYYYDKMGPQNPLNLKITEYNPKTGKLKLEETNANGEVTGTFIGTLSADDFTGSMTSYRGQTFNTVLKVNR